MGVDISVEIAGLRFKNPILNAACPISRDGRAMERLAEGGAGGLVTKTISITAARVPRPHMGAINRTYISLIVPQYRNGKLVTRITKVRGAVYGFLNAELWSDLPPEQWFREEIPYARKVAEKYGIPLIASLGYKAHELKELGPKAVKAGAQAIEFSTHYLGFDYRPVIESAKALRESVDVPIFPKLSPHIMGLRDMVKELEKIPVDGIVAINTLGPTLHIDIETGKPLMGGPSGHGWLSGPCIKPLGIAIVAEIAKTTKLPIIGVGGIANPEDVIEYIMAGATAVQVCTQAIIEGPQVFRRLAEGVAKWLKEHGYSSIEDVRGMALKYLPSEAAWYESRPPRVDESKCIACGLCEQMCDYDAVRLVEKNGRKVPVVDIAKCYGCGTCTSVCPTRAIYFPEEYWR
ncbi:MAG TPA: 4Fe-4S dicluster domain-containing protein [Acidilobales archaeon]|nr:4Fe-4S dicluster domain-containing protein [Acidilobales archaeon]